MPSDILNFGIPKTAEAVEVCADTAQDRLKAAGFAAAGWLIVKGLRLRVYKENAFFAA